MIESFGDTETERIYGGERSRKLPGDIQHRARRKLRMINQARALQDLSVPPGNRLEALQGDLEGFWSIRINQQWRIIFRWDDGRKSDVSITDYH
ncbi:type II toxin-antitoxin system RelE/ParE family toxin [Haloferula sp. A504]|uniref:type II toxin-antitoxin system RelE/ParE family toxin n=1 Tax=Haloferula sp. A504 TaxID=3373601 RepID=UPI0031BE2228|nr:type II toxin-antitoxin system RelE/ParE family toxin [Verrucomicrobiaceae bacterium E54]